ncbi:M3 family metallopeptidase [Nakamurella deserti]|uniref:M3 family metallopeptidase n=1 Tax=Nakamurella deserti TaxID=2164074 RepID=UPI000DBE1ABF|nr:M3 family metallopeptidase [Nakamurella deserti]
MNTVIHDPSTNPLSTPSTLPFELPPFAAITPDHVRAAFDAGMAEQLAEVAAITGQAAAPTFANTVEALERSGRLLHRTASLFSNLAAAHATAEYRAIEADIAPRLTAHADALSLDPALFARLDAVHSDREHLDAESRRLVERYHLDFVRAGARLDPTQADQLRELNREISVLGTTFGQNLLAATSDAAVLVDSAAELDGLTPEDVAAAAERAAEAGHPGRWMLALGLPTGQPVLARLTDRALRERVHRASVGRASCAPYDNGPLAIRIARLRAQRARLLGYPDHAAYVAADNTAGSPAAVDALLAQLVPAAVANAEREAALLAEAAAADGIDTLQPWDWKFYSEKVQASRYAVDTAALRDHLSFDRVLQDGVFRAANLLYGLSFTARPDLVGYHPDVRIFEVTDTDGGPLGLFVLDPYARAEKRGGAWMNTFVDQNGLFSQRPVVTNNLNLDRPAPGELALLTPDEVRTMFHEFGHALHGLFSAVRYPRFSGTNVPGDFVEFPSQVNEMWQWWPEILTGYARHHRTGEPLPADTVARLDAAELWGQGFATVEYLAATLLDQAWHRITPDTVIDDAAAFERAALAKAGVAMDLVPPRYRTTYFQHIFNSGYAAGYYFYIWAEVLDADTVEWFKAHGGLQRANGDRFRSALLSAGGARDAMGTVREVLGREPEIGPLLRRRGLTGG